jgi:hypothetical protein
MDEDKELHEAGKESYASTKKQHAEKRDEDRMYAKIGNDYHTQKADREDSMRKDAEHALKQAEYYRSKTPHHKPMMSEIHKAAEELRMEGKGSHDPVYENSKKNK